MARIAVLGGGAVGSLIAHTLDALRHDVFLLDASEPVLERNLKITPSLQTRKFDGTSYQAYTKLPEQTELAINALPGWLGHFGLKALLDQGLKVVDISFTPEEALLLDPLAKRKGCFAVVDAGVAPGLSNLLAGQLVSKSEAQPRELQIFVGGLPFRRDPPWEYAAPFSVSDVLEEYTRPARLKEQGQLVEVPALSGRRPINVPEIGELEAFLTDGLRSLLNLPVPEMSEFTLRYPGHAAKVELLREAGFFSTTPIKTNSGPIVPREVALELLGDQWKLVPGEAEFTYLLVELKDEGGQRQSFELLDRGEGIWTSMARTTGLTTVAFTQLVLEGKIDGPGVHPPEEFGADEDLVALVLGFLKNYQVFVRQA